MVGMLIVLLFAGQHTSSISVTWLGVMLLSHPEALAEVTTEEQSRRPAPCHHLAAARGTAPSSSGR